MTNEHIGKIALIGRTNVGKSTLFNRLTSTHKAIVSPFPGTTRDRNFGECFWNGKTFTLIDTGGLENPNYKKYSNKTEKKHLLEIEENVKKQALIALNQADLIVFVTDIKTGILPQDQEVVKLLRQASKPVILAVNKATSKKIREAHSAEYYKLGLGRPFLISATTGAGTGDLLDEIIKQFPKQRAGNLRPPFFVCSDRSRTMSRAEGSRERNQRVLRLPILGRPNVGKSSLLNCLAQEERVIVNPQPHTTREIQESTISHKGQNIQLVDTAGVRRQPKIKNHLEKLGVRQSLNILKKSDLILFIIDSSQGLSKQDQALARLIKESYTPVIIIANKWDLVKGIEMSEFEQNFKKYFPHLSFAPIVFTSCKTKRNLDKILNLALEISEESKTEIIPNALNKFLTRIMGDLRKFQGKSKSTPRLLDLKQTRAKPPVFEIIMKESRLKKPHPSIVKYVENQLREKFNLKRVPIKIALRTVKIKP